MRAYLYLWLDVHHIFNGGTSDSKLSPYLYCPRQYYVCVLLQWCTLHGISVLLYVESTFCSVIINYHSSHPVFSPPKSPKNTCAREKNQSERQKIRSLITENPPSRNRKPRFASALITVHRPLPRRQPLCPFRPRGRQSVAAAAQRPYVLMFLCPFVSRVSGCQTPLRRQPLCLLRPPGRQSVAVSRAAALCVSYVNLFHLCFPR